jgi:hydrogenase expression/formation protein HypD
MRYLEEFRDKKLAMALAGRIEKRASGMPDLKFMEVCGSHTMAIARYGLRKILPENIQLISGPGCPVCVTANGYLDKAIALGRLEDVVLCTFGDMMRVPGSSTSLEQERAIGRNIKVVYSTLDAVRLAEKNPQKKIIFLGVGFETTAPTIAASVLQAERIKLNNYFVLCAHKTMPRPMEAIARGEKVTIDGFICPAHVSTIIGSKPYEFLAKDFGNACVIAGFEPLDILEAIDMLIDQVKRKERCVEIQYSRVTTVDGNRTALALMEKVFEPCDTEWRGIGTIPESGLKLNSNYSKFDADLHFKVEVEPTREETGCICGEVMQGISIPTDCPLFATACTPELPIGACMVSSEGSCAAYYKYEQAFPEIE